MFLPGCCKRWAEAGPVFQDLLLDEFVAHTLEDWQQTRVEFFLAVEQGVA